MDSVAVAFAIPSRVALETDEGRRSTGYVTHFEGGCIWVYLRGAADPSLRSSVRLVFRREGESSLGMGGTVIWSAQDRVAVEVQHPVDRAIVRQWACGEAADVSDFVRLDRTELPTAEFSPVGVIGGMAEAAAKTDPTPADDPRRSPARSTPTVDEGAWPQTDREEQPTAVST